MYTWLCHRMQLFKIDNLVRLCQKGFRFSSSTLFGQPSWMYLKACQSTRSCYVQCQIWVLVTVASSRCWVSNTNSARVGTTEGVSVNGNLLNVSALLCYDVEWNSVAYSNEARVRAQYWILLEACTSTCLLSAINDWSGLWSVISEKWCPYKYDLMQLTSKMQVKCSFLSENIFKPGARRPQASTHLVS